MTWIIFLLYLLLFSWIITRVKFFRNSGLGNATLVILFLIKIAAGVAYFQYYSTPANKPTSDTWRYYEEGKQETDLLLDDPVTFVTGIFQTNDRNTGNLFTGDNSYWNDIRDELMVKLMAVFNVFTWKSYYANLVLFNFFFLFGLVALFRLVKETYGGNKWLIAASVFLLPSTLFWCSGIHKDGLILSALGMFFYSVHRLLNRPKARFVVIILICLLLVFLLRNYLVVVMLAALVVIAVVHFFYKQRWLLFSLLVGIGILLVFTGRHLHPSLDIPRYIVAKHQQFKGLTGGSVIDTRELAPGAVSFASYLPTAIDIGFLRPHPNEGGLVGLLSSIEIIVFWLLCIGLIIYTRKSFVASPVTWGLWFFALATLIIIGYTVTFSGAVVRYRALVLPFILAPILAHATASTRIIKNYIYHN